MSNLLNQIQLIGDRLSFVLLVVVCAFVFPWEANLCVFLLLLILQTTSSLLRPSSAKAGLLFRRFVRYFLLLTLLMVAVNALLLREGKIIAEVFGVSLFQGGAIFGLTTGLRLLVLATALGILFGSTPLAEFADYLGNVGLPSSVVLTLLLSLYFVETLPHRISRIFTAQEARGVPVRSNLFARIRVFSILLMPLMLSSIIESIDRGMSLELRGFHSESRISREGLVGVRRTISRRSAFFLLLASAVITLRLALWLTQ